MSGGRFELLEELGAGGMGTVWKARDTDTGTLVALKLLHHQFVADAEYVARFEREVEIARKVDSPHVVKVLGFGRQDGAPYVVMEYIDGRSLKELIRERGPLEWEGEGRRIAVAMTRGLGAAHAAGVVHRDVKPSNILLDHSGGVYLADFGIARAADLTRLTGSLTVLGTPAYMAPDRTVDERSDLYALGCVVFEMLTGEPPFVGESQQQVLLQHLRDAPELSGVPVEARRIVAWLLQKDAAKRPASAQALLAVLQGTGSAPAPGRARLVRPRWAAAGLLGVAGLGVAALAAAALGGGEDDPADRADGDLTSSTGSPVLVTPTPTLTLAPAATATIVATAVTPSATLAAVSPSSMSPLASPGITSASSSTPTPTPPSATPLPGTLRFSDGGGSYPVGENVIDICWDAQPHGAVFTITITKVAPSSGAPDAFEFTDTGDGMVNCYLAKAELTDLPFVEFRLEARNAIGLVVASQTNRYSTYVSDFDPEYSPTITFVAGPNQGQLDEPLIFDVSWQDRNGNAVSVSLTVEGAVHAGTEEPYSNVIDVSDVPENEQEAGSTTRFGLICRDVDMEPRTMTFTVTDAAGLSDTRTAQLRCVE